MDLSSLTTVIAEQNDHVLTITLNRPDRMNSFTNVMRSEFRSLWHYAAETDDVHVVVLRANGDRAFSTGMDVKEGTYVAENVFTRRDPGADLSPKQNGCWKPLVCAVHGMVAGGALYWINEADIIIASDDAQFFDPHVSYGLVAALEPIGLAHRIPIGEVLRMVLLGLDERMSAERAREIGLVSEIVSRGDLWDRAQDLAGRIAAKPAAAIQGSIRAIWESKDSTRSHALATAMSYTSLGNPIGKAQVSRSEVPTRKYEVR
ncbi:enoyl-CoA hydratase/isomerase family protein [Rhodococcus sp. ACPA4]|uniref:Enoyl-CoA hydratase/carnithine racemase n=2 Tax=Nocardiaceae TaxID=85025 RepID=A0A652YHE3_NOCGL|nr:MULTISPECIES: enoyl-CoA hydratase/isomerase family protein [Rhodococcus]MCE4265794.1 enoyl-CoA hydratase/isomerase family protein [Rhodococcus globerulus]MDV6270508.1 enoyl-CoA hydratase/isomerase family protein [Rhodococcus globerulus]MDV8071076.1 enoyl-CoA hydratase/isomerase family protein [Rhodococcus sp. IEGM 1366]PBC42947.1 enoyl-CoA hydratase/isomerase family protein [Rhodococcus sp. ACPA4]PVX63377.1 enoyl-CoA hydratase/carnithine racemase [Rhodococcus globerulus]